MSVAPGTGLFSRTPHAARTERNEAIAKWLFFAMAVAMIVPLFAIIGYLLYRAAPSLSWEFLVEVPKKGMREGGIWSAFVGTLYLVGMSLAVAAPIGVLAAIYLHEYAKDNWFNRLINLAVINLAGVPSIVHALFGLGAFVYAARFGYSILSASLTLAIMTLPVIIASTREALASVPVTFREACWNVGATRWQAIRAVVLPNSISGILTGVILQVSRAAGEPYKDSLLELPAFLLSSQGGLDEGDIRRGLAITGHFLEQFVFAPLNLPLPHARVWLIDRRAAAERR